MTVNAVPYVLQAPVQADRTADSIVALSQQIRGYLGPNGVTEEELSRTVAKSTNALPGAVRDVGRGAQRDADQRVVRAPGQLLRTAGGSLPRPDPKQPRHRDPRR